MRVKPDKIVQLMGYREISNVYILICNLVDQGLTTFKIGCLCALWFESTKVVEFDEYIKEERQEAISVLPLESGGDLITDHIF